MKAGKLFEEALKEAGIDLKAGTHLSVRVQDRDNHLHLVVTPGKPSDFEREILTRSLRAAEPMAVYEPDLTFGETVRALRKAAGLTLEVLAIRAKMSKGSLGSIEKGERNAGLAVIKKIARALEVPLSLLVK